MIRAEQVAGVTLALIAAICNFLYLFFQGRQQSNALHLAHTQLLSMLHKDDLAVSRMSVLYCHTGTDPMLHQFNRQETSHLLCHSSTL